MVKKSHKTIYSCQTCGYQAPKWMGKCPDCGAWDAFVEERSSVAFSRRSASTISGPPTAPVPIDCIELDMELRLLTRIQEFDRVLGGGLVPGTLVLIGGDPGIGKSTLMLQVLFGLADQGHKVLYVSGEESNRQIRLRSKRLNTVSPNILVVSEVEVAAIMSMIETTQPKVIVVDSIQTMFNADLTSAPGSVSQVREATVQLMLMAKKSEIPTLLVGHVTKDGAIAGPKLLEHMVDTVLYFEGDRNHIFRILRAVKNRFGSTNEIGVFEMKDSGLDEVANPSAVFLSERPAGAPPKEPRWRLLRRRKRVRVPERSPQRWQPMGRSSGATRGARASAIKRHAGVCAERTGRPCARDDLRIHAFAPDARGR